VAEWFFLERILADRARDLASHVATAAAFRHPDVYRERPVLTAGIEGWSWRRTAQVAALVGLALVSTIALPMGIAGATWVVGVLVNLLLG
jgi:hypothetical protein